MPSNRSYYKQKLKTHPYVFKSPPYRKTRIRPESIPTTLKLVYVPFNDCALWMFTTADDKETFKRIYNEGIDHDTNT